MVRVLFVCTGNICRSPAARGVFEGVVRREGLEGEIEADSAGTHAFYHAGEAADPRASESALARGVDLSAHRARLVEREECGRFDYVLAMDRENLRLLEALCRGTGAEVALFLDYAPGRPEREIPDPYYGGPEGFEHVLDLVEEASEGLLEDIRQRHLGGGGG
jgi:protein-tyrosine phosphatase